MTERVWTVRDALTWTVDHFDANGVPEPRRSAEWLMSAATGLTRVELYTQFDRPLTDQERATLRESVRRRAAGEPLQYVTGEMPFRHLVLKVRPGVFIPRPETEVLVDVALEALDADPGASTVAHPDASDAGAPVVIDLCCGSGAVAVSIAHERPGVRVWATDVSPLAVEVTRANAEAAGAADRVTVIEGDLFAGMPDELRGHVAVVVSNPPYIPTSDMAALPAEVSSHEPHRALDGGADGLDVVRRIIEDARTWLAPAGALVIETDTNRAKDAVSHMAAWYEGCSVVADLTGRDRIATGRAREAK